MVGSAGNLRPAAEISSTLASKAKHPPPHGGQICLYPAAVALRPFLTFPVEFFSGNLGREVRRPKTPIPWATSIANSSHLSWQVSRFGFPFSLSPPLDHPFINSKVSINSYWVFRSGWNPRENPLGSAFGLN